MMIEQGQRAGALVDREGRDGAAVKRKKRRDLIHCVEIFLGGVYREKGRVLQASGDPDRGELAGLSLEGELMDRVGVGADIDPISGRVYARRGLWLSGVYDRHAGRHSGRGRLDLRATGQEKRREEKKCFVQGELPLVL